MTGTGHPPLRFAAIGLDHRHIYDQVQSLLDAGGECAGYWTDGDPKPLEGFVKRFPHVPRVADRRALLDDASIRLITCAAVFDQRADLAIEAMRAGKDFMADKPGVTTLDQLERVRRVQRETARIWTVNFTERFEVRAVTRALELVRAGAIGRSSRSWASDRTARTRTRARRGSTTSVATAASSPTSAATRSTSS